MESGDPRTVIDPEDGILTNEPSKVKRIIKEAIAGKTGEEGVPLTERKKWHMDMVEEKEDLEGTYGGVEIDITEKEVAGILSGADYDTAAGADGLGIGIYKIIVTHAKSEDNTMLKLITMAANAIKKAEGKMRLHKEGIGKMLWKKKGSKKTENLRPITLHNAIGKITSKIIADRLTKELTSRHLLHRANEGFLIEKGCHNAIHTILGVWEDSKEYKKGCYNMMYGVSGAYDRITHDQIKRGMEILHLPEHTQNYIMNKMKGGTYSIKTGHGMTEAFEVKRGCPQGCPLSPIIYIIAMNPLHEGLERNPLYGGEKFGYVMTNRQRPGENEPQLGSKGYADDTAVMTGSIDGLKKMTEWVNEFCITNRVSMNARKSILFGRDEEGKEMQQHVETITHVRPEGEEGPGERKDGAIFWRERVDPTNSGSKQIKYLGIHMNMELDWEKQIAVMSSTIGMYRHLAIANNLSAEQTVILFNNYLKPKLEYRMQFVDLTEAKLKNWSSQLTRTLTQKLTKGNEVKREAIKLCMGLRLPSEYYQETQLTQALKKLNDQTDMGETARTRMVWRSNRKYKHANATYRQMMEAKKRDFFLTENPEYGRPTLQAINENTIWMHIKIGGKTYKVPQDHEGIWGNEEERIEAKIFTGWVGTSEEKWEQSGMGGSDDERLDEKELETTTWKGT